MYSFDMPPVPDDGVAYDQFRADLVALHQIAAPGCTPGFTAATMRYSGNPYFYFPHPDDHREVFEYALELSADADEVQRSLIIPTAIVAAHPFEDGSGRTARADHARRMGKSAEEIAQLGICGPRLVLQDERAQKVIDLRPPKMLLPHIEGYVYEANGVDKRVKLRPDYDIMSDGIKSYQAVYEVLPGRYRKSLRDTLGVTPFNDEYCVRLDDPESLNFALNVQGHDGAMVKGLSDVLHTLADAGEDGLKQVVDDMWRFRLLRARAHVSCLGNTMLGSQKIRLADQSGRQTITSHYIRLSNNLIADR